MPNNTDGQPTLGGDSFKPETICRVHRHERNYVQVENATAQDKRLSWAARGLLVYLLSLPTDWEIRVSHLINQGDMGRDALRRTLHELQSFGYASGVGRDSQERSERGRFGPTEIAVYETPALNPFFSRGDAVTPERVRDPEKAQSTVENTQSSVDKTRNPASEKAQSTVAPSPEIPSTVAPSPDSPSPEIPSTYKEQSPQRTNETNPTHTNSGLRAVGAPAVVVGGSKFTLPECRRYAEHLHSTGQGINNPGGFARRIHGSGSEDEMIALFLARLEPERVESGELPAPLDTSACPDCEGRTLRPVAGRGDYSKGVTKCKHDALLNRGAA
ncbi:MAG TPA: hypothetical protein VK363_19225 [Pyrinomonadaceae bacterium]|nr:hypothetical protein [Pyrinomonadaceae bacterium]